MKRITTVLLALVVGAITANAQNDTKKPTLAQRNSIQALSAIDNSKLPRLEASTNKVDALGRQATAGKPQTEKLGQNGCQKATCPTQAVKKSKKTSTKKKASSSKSKKAKKATPAQKQKPADDRLAQG